MGLTWEEEGRYLGAKEEADVYDVSGSLFFLQLFGGIKYYAYICTQKI
jgi:hypothetical protein